MTTLGDEMDQAFKNRSEVGMVAWQKQLPGETKSNQSWHQGMLGHGSALPGGDRDHIALLGHEGVAKGNEEYFEVPEYATAPDVLEREAKEQDLADGKQDDAWFGDDILKTHDNPAWVRYQETVMTRILKRENYGQDEITDFFFANFKVTDIVGHRKHHGLASYGGRAGGSGSGARGVDRIPR